MPITRVGSVVIEPKHVGHKNGQSFKQVAVYKAHNYKDLKRARLVLIDSGVSRTLVHADGLYLCQFKQV